MNKKQRLVALVGVVALVSVWLLAGSVSSFEFENGQFFYQGDDPVATDGESAPTVTDMPGIPDWVRIVILVTIWVLLPASILLMIFRPRLLKTVLIRSAVLGLWLFMIMLFTKAASQIGEALNPELNEEAVGTPIEDIAINFPDAANIDVPWWTQWLAALIAVTIGGWIFYQFTKYWKQRNANTLGLEAALADEAGQAAQALRQGGSFEAVVMQCYQRMCELLTRHQRDPLDSLTPREFEVRLYKAGVQDPLITRLSRLFERVRYGNYTEMSDDKHEALSCLESIEQKYRSDS